MPEEKKQLDWWDDSEDSREPLVADRHYFCFLQMFQPKVTKSFEKGVHFTIPNVYDDQWDQDSETNIRNGLKKFKGWTRGGPATLYILVATMTQKTGQQYQRVKQYPSQPARKGETVLWLDKIRPALIASIPAKDRRKLVENGLWVEMDEQPTGETFEADNGNVYDIKYWTNFKIYPDQASWKAAETEWRKQFETDDNNSSGQFDHFPISWATNPQLLIDHANGSGIKENPTSEILNEFAISAMIIDEKGTPSEAIGGGQVEPVSLLAELAGVPEPMIKL